MNSISNTEDYNSSCRIAYQNDESFRTFKRNHSYNGILEHVSEEQGSLYLDYLEKNFPLFMWDMDKFKKNDIYGEPRLSNYAKTGEISPSTLRYIKVLADLKSIFGNLNGKKIIEIGGGYGGQCFVSSQVFDFSEYSIVDLDDPLLLTDRYLNTLDTSHRLININEVEKLDETFDLVISNYAYSEVDKELQDLYWNKIIKNSRNGYFTLNFISHIFQIDSYSLDELILKFFEKSPKLFEEEPKTFEKNIILYF